MTQKLETSSGRLAAAEHPTPPTRNQLLRLYHWQHLATDATRTAQAARRVHELLATAYGPDLGEHLAGKLLHAEGGSVAGWLLTLDTANTRTFWTSDELNV